MPHLGSSGASLPETLALHRPAKSDVEPGAADILDPLASQHLIGAEDGLLKLSLAWTHLEEVHADAPVEPLALVSDALHELARLLLHQTPPTAPVCSRRVWLGM